WLIFLKLSFYTIIWTLPDEAEDYYITHYTKVDAYSFEIKDGFPRIRVQDIPSEIFNVQYELAVGQCLNFAITVDELIKGVTK
ncbi:PD-(D/E)XK motif protein, partial [Acidaminococcus timonensis]|uniref:PD-(D/E)XK motif protein n=1 Tax=Acidaminococcus timonensis TaxID=1871002 RepID=UPI002943E9EE